MSSNEKAGPLVKSVVGRSFSQHQQDTTTRQYCASHEPIAQLCVSGAATDCAGLTATVNPRQLILFDLNGAMSEPYVPRRITVKVGVSKQCPA